MPSPPWIEAERLTRLAPLVVFSAAIPGQGGQYHVNEQWPSYWIEHFRRAGYEVFDVLRPRIWGDRQIPYWYRQNILVFAARTHSELITSLQTLAAGGDFRGTNLVHPDHAMRALQYPGLGALARAFPYAFVRSLAALPNWRIRREPTPLPMPEREPYAGAP